MASSSSTSTAEPQRKHHVFLSFRGEDTRVGFTSHLHAALGRKNILAFIDNDLKRGEEISPSLVKAIEDSMLSVIIFSEQYASSRWCLKELVKILECRKTRGQIVIPIFYKVDPSHVRNQIESFGDAFAELVKMKALKMEEKGRFRDALKEAANISGHDSRNMVSEAKFIEEIVEDILNKMSKMISCRPMNLVGIAERIREIESVLEMESQKVRFVGIWGMGGIGKTTIAGAVYSKICTQFEASLFVPNIREELTRRTVVDLQRSFVSKLLGQEIRDMVPLSFGNHFVKDGLRHRRVLIVFDDVDSSTPLQELLLGQHDSFGPGSRILVTSRDRHVLEQVVDATYEVKPLNHNEALVLFISKAFKKFVHTSDHRDLLEMVVNYAKGNPLALLVLGSALCDRSREYWKSKLDGLGKGQDVDILKVLRTSYDGLNEYEKNSFLDIACFLRGMDRYRVTRILEKKFPSAFCCISNLIDKSLITASRNRLWMHDLLQEMAWRIVSDESENRGKRSRLFDPEDICYVLEENEGTNAIKGIRLDMPASREMRLKSDAFARMRCLEVLIIEGETSKLKLPDGGFECLPEKLIYFCWNGYSSRSLSQNFCAANLVEFDFQDSKVEKLWSGRQLLVNLRRINLCDSHRLIKLPDLSEAKKLKCVDLEGCSSLIEVPSYFQYFEDLEELCLAYCYNLQSLPRKINSNNIKDLSLEGCSKITKFPTISGSSRLIQLYLTDCKKLSSLPNSICGLKSLEELSLSGTAIRELPSSIAFLTYLRYLYLRNCKKLSSLPNSICGLKSLETLDLSESAITSLPSSIRFLTNLTLLNLTNCKKLSSLPNSICGLKYLEILHLSGTAITSLPSSIGSLINLTDLYLKNCKKLSRLPNSICELKSLKELSLSGTAIRELPSSIRFLTNLTHLDLEDCKKLSSLPNSICELKSLKELHLSGTAIRELPELPPSLVHLLANECESLEIISSSTVGSSKGALRFANCFKLDQKALMEDVQLKIQSGKIEDGFAMVLPGSEIPQWFSYQSRGSSITIQFPSNTPNLKAIAFCWVVYPNNNPVDILKTRLGWEAKITGGERDYFSYVNVRVVIPESYHMYLSYHNISNYRESKYLGHEVRFEFNAGRGTLKVKMCGVYLIPENPDGLSISDEDE